MRSSVKRMVFHGEIPSLDAWSIEGYRRIEALHAFRRACFSELVGRLTRGLRLTARHSAEQGPCRNKSERDAARRARIALERIDAASPGRRLPLRRYREIWVALYLDEALVDRTVLPVRLIGGRLLLAGDAGDAVRLSVLRARGVRHVAVATADSVRAEIRCSVFGGAFPGPDVGYHHENEDENNDDCDVPQRDARCVHGAGCLL